VQVHIANVPVSEIVASARTLIEVQAAKKGLSDQAARARLSDAPQPRSRVHLKRSASPGKLEYFFELVGPMHNVALTRAPTCWRVFHGLTHERKLAGGGVPFLEILDDKPLDVKLTEHQAPPCAVVAEIRDVFVNFALRVLFLWRIRRGVSFFEELISQHESVLTPNGARPRLPGAGPFPRSQKESDLAPSIGRYRRSLSQGAGRGNQADDESDNDDQ
jgi:hypothetical protein